MLAAENLGISYGGRRLFGGLNFTLRAGERFSLAGPNGAGKSTLMKIVADLEHADALEAFGDLQLRLEHHDVSRMKPQIEVVLTGLGFSLSDMDRLTDEFSGGWQMRIALAKLLLAEPSVLLLDEPTNHLDIETVVWLENYLNTYHGAILIISHDRRLLDNLT